MNTFEKKVALVTGASYGIGLAIAKELASRGAHLILAARSGEKLEALASSIRSEGGKAYTFNADLSISCLLYTSPSPRDRTRSRMPSSA